MNAVTSKFTPEGARVGEYVKTPDGTRWYADHAVFKDGSVDWHYGRLGQRLRAEWRPTFPWLVISKW